VIQARGRLFAAAERFCVDQDGVAAAVVAMFMVVLVGIAGFAIDVGRALYIQRSLQASTDAAALAGADNLINGTGVATAQTYSAAQKLTNGAAGLNPVPGASVPLASVSVTLKCFSQLAQTGAPCIQAPAGTSDASIEPSGGGANGVSVTQRASIQTYFLRVLLINSLPVVTTSSASASGGSDTPLDVMIVLDTMGGNSLLSTNLTDPVSLASPVSLADLPNAPCRMNTKPGTILTYLEDLLINQCAPTSNSKLSNTLAGIRTFLGTVNPCPPTLTSCGPATNGNVANPSVEVGLMVFPGFTNTAQAQYDYETGPCASATEPAIAAYYNSPVYAVVGLSSDYRTSAAATGLNAASNLALAAGWATGCGAWAVNPPSLQLLYGSFFADAITAAQTALTNDGRTGARKAIIFVSDGNADALSQLATVTVTAGGSGYTAGANVTFSGGMGSGATGLANVVGGVVTSVTLTNGGSGYSSVSPPTVVITPKNAVLGLGGSGGGAVAQVTLYPGLNQCHQAIAAAQTASAAGTLVYSVAYGANVLPALTCLTDILPQPSYLIPLIAACTTMQEIASDPTKFFAVNINDSICTSSVNSQSDLSSIFAAIATSLSGARLVPSNTT